MITDTEGNKEKFRILIDQYWESLPKGLKKGIKQNNRNNLVLNNGSVLDYLVAGTRTKGGGLGRSRAYNFLHATEMSSWGDPEGVASLMAALAEKHPDRLYIFESTARGFNLFWDMWRSARDDRETQVPIFIGWWAKEDYTVDRNSEIFRKYWTGSVSTEEKEKIDYVARHYGVKIIPEQIAWYRWKNETRMFGEGYMASEFPWTEEEAFVATGKGFFPAKKVSDDIKHIYETSLAFEGYYYHMTNDFCETRIERAKNRSEIDLRIYEYPNEKGYYAIGVDPAYGRDETNDRSVIQIFRCYADKMVQVAEYATPIPETHHLAWVLCHLAGNYKNCWINLELTGPGYAVMKEMETLKLMMRNGYFDKTLPAGDGLLNFFDKAKWYIYRRPDNPAASGYILNWKTTSENKQTIFNQTRDMYNNGALTLKSIPLLEEFQTIVQDGFEIKAAGSNKDDRAFATCLAVRMYLDWMRTPLINQKLTEEKAIEIENNKGHTYSNTIQNIYDDYMKSRRVARNKAQADHQWDEGYGHGRDDFGYEDEDYYNA